MTENEGFTGFLSISSNVRFKWDCLKYFQAIFVAFCYEKAFRVEKMEASPHSDSKE